MSFNAPHPPELFTHLSRLIPEPLLLVSSEGMLLSGNASARTLLGLDAEEPWQAPLVELTEEPPERVTAFLRQCLRSLEPLPGSFTLRLTSGARERLVCRGARLSPEDSVVMLHFPIESQTRKAFGLLSQQVDELTREVSRRRQTEEHLAQSEQHMKTVIDTLPVGVWITDEKGQILSGNPAGKRIWGGELRVGRKDYGMYHAQWADTGRPLTPEEWGVSRALTRGETSLGDLLRIRSFDGQEKFILNSAVPLRNDKGQIVGAIAVNEDVTERRRADEELRQAMELQESFIGIVSHDVRSPLAAILMSTLQLRRHTLDEPSRKIAERIDRAARRIEQVVKLLLDFTRAKQEQGIPLVPRQLSLYELCGRVMDEMKAAYPHCVVELHGPPAWGEGDPERLFQVIANLLENAFKYGAASRPVTLTTYEAEDELRLAVHNEGEPIPEELRARLFEPFSRGAQTEETVKVSLGLGLHIAHEIIRAHGGSVEVRSTHVEGTTFILRLPRRSEAQALQNVRGESAPLKKLNDVV